MLVQPQRSFPEADGVSRPDAEAAKFAFVELHPKATTRVSGDFLRRLIAAVLYRIHTVLTDNCIQFTTPGAGGSAKPMIKEALAKGELFRAHSFELVCASAEIDHRTTQPRRPWTNGQVERMNWRIKDATVKRFHYADHDELRAHLADFVAAYNYARLSQDHERPHAVRTHLRALDKRPSTLQA